MDKQIDFEKGWEEYKAKSKQEIKEMIGIIQNAVGGCAEHWAKLIAEELHKNRYRKKEIPENAVVLTKEEWAKRNAEIEIIKIDNDTYLKEAKRVCELELKARRELEKLKRDFDYNLVQERKQIRKETAERFAERLKEKLNEWLEDNEDLNGKINFGIAQIELIGVESLDGEIISESLIDEIAEEITEGEKEISNETI